MDKTNIFIKSATINSQVKSQLGINAYKTVKEMIQNPVDKLWSQLKQENTFCRKIINTTQDDFLQLAKFKKGYYALWIDSLDNLAIKSAFDLLPKKFLIYLTLEKNLFILDLPEYLKSGFIS